MAIAWVNNLGEKYAGNTAQILCVLGGTFIDEPWFCLFFFFFPLLGFRVDWYVVAVELLCDGSFHLV